MSWITVEQVETVLRRDLSDDDHITPLIDHVQSLCELEVGEQEAPSSGLQAVVTDITARFWRSSVAAEQNPAGYTQEQTGPFSFQDQQARSAGLGLTNREKDLLRKAVGVRSGVWTLETTRGDDLGSSVENPYSES